MRGIAAAFAGLAAFAADAGALLTTCAAVSDTTTMDAASPPIIVDNPSRIEHPPCLSAERLLAPLTVQQLLDELHALEIHELRVLLQTPVEGHADLPRAREDFGVFDRGLVREDVGARAPVAFNDMQRVAVEVTGSVEPALIVEARHVDDQRVSFPVADRLAHPRVYRSGAGIFQIDVANGARVFVGEKDRLRALKNLERIGHVGGARHAGQVAFD